MPDPISTVSGVGPSVPAPLVNPQVQAEKPRAVADTAGATGATGAAVPNANQARSSVSGSRNNESIAPNRSDRPNSLNGLPESTQTEKSNEVSKEAVSFTQEDVEEAVESFREFLQKLPSEMEFSFDKDIDRYLFKLVNPHTKEVVRQYPPDEFVTMVKRLKEVAPDSKSSRNGILFDDRL